MSATKSDGGPNKAASENGVAGSGGSGATSVLRRNSILTPKQQAIAEKYVPLAMRTAKRVAATLRRRGRVPDDDQILSDSMLRLVQIAAKIDSQETLDILFNFAFTRVAATIFHRQSTSRWNRRVQVDDEVMEKLLPPDEIEVDVIAEAECPFQDELRDWLSQDSRAEAKFADESTRQVWQRKKLPKIKKHLEKIYGDDAA
jgi:hypothetical protein